jgi:DNA primase
MKEKKKYLSSKELTERISPGRFYSDEGIEIPASKKSGWTIAGICPFHAHRKKGPFHINLDTGAYKCFSCKARGGNITNFYMNKYGVEFREALEKLDERYII